MFINLAACFDTSHVEDAVNPNIPLSSCLKYNA